MPDPTRSRVVYVTSDSSQWLILDVPFGLITPPLYKIPLHKPFVGVVEFYYAECYQLPIPPEAEAALKAAGGDES